jgi:hypothetical protein
MSLARDFGLIELAAQFTLDGRAVPQNELGAAGETAETSYIANTSGPIRGQFSLRVILCISAFRALLQYYQGWQRPLAEAAAYVRSREKAELAHRLADIADAVTVLQYGSGPGLERLLARQAQLRFTIETSANGRSIAVDERLLAECVDVMREVVATLEDI